MWNDLLQEIMPFFKIRRYGTCTGRHLGCEQGSPPSPDEHLMIVFHDLLLLDNARCINKAYEGRRAACTHLSVLFQEGPKIGQQEKVDFRKPQAAASLGLRFTSAILQK